MVKFIRPPTFPLYNSEIIAQSRNSKKAQSKVCLRFTAVAPDGSCQLWGRRENITNRQRMFVNHHLTSLPSYWYKFKNFTWPWQAPHHPALQTPAGDQHGAGGPGEGDHHRASGRHRPSSERVPADAGSLPRAQHQDPSPHGGLLGGPQVCSTHLWITSQ